AASWLDGLPPPERWRARLLSEGPRLATWALALVLGVPAAFIVTDLARAGCGARKAAARAQPFQARDTDVAAIPNALLFGAAPLPKQSDADAPQTSMPLV